jgi:hypothetical protein
LEEEKEEVEEVVVVVEHQKCTGSSLQQEAAVGVNMNCIAIVIIITIVVADMLLLLLLLLLPPVQPVPTSHPSILNVFKNNTDIRFKSALMFSVVWQLLFHGQFSAISCCCLFCFLPPPLKTAASFTLTAIPRSTLHPPTFTFPCVLSQHTPFMQHCFAPRAALPLADHAQLRNMLVTCRPVPISTLRPAITFSHQASCR